MCVCVCEKLGQHRVEVAETCSNHFKPFKKVHTIFVFGLVNFLYFYTFIQEKGDKFFVRFTAIIIFPQRRDTVFSLYCATQRKKGILDSERNRKDAYTTKGFSSWKKHHIVSKNTTRRIVIKMQLRIMLLFQSARM